MQKQLTAINEQLYNHLNKYKKKAVIVIALACELQSQHEVIRSYRMSVLTANVCSLDTTKHQIKRQERTSRSPTCWCSTFLFSLVSLRRFTAPYVVRQRDVFLVSTTLQVVFVKWWGWNVQVWLVSLCGLDCTLSSENSKLRQLTAVTQPVVFNGNGQPLPAPAPAEFTLYAYHAYSASRIVALNPVFLTQSTQPYQEC